MNLPEIYTIGVYGYSEREFFQKLTDNHIDTFCDILRRRAVRGSQYAFANSQRLQRKLSELSINYHYEIELAPTVEVIEIQNKFDKRYKIQRRKREELSADFKQAYTDKILSHFDMEQFLTSLAGTGSKKVALFCVERSPGACHRSLVTKKIREVYPRIKIFHI